MSCRKKLLQVEITVPSYFLCPISLELMLDPVTLSSGQTFDRRSIELWLQDGHGTCPVTRLPIAPDQEEPIPNHTLRRMIQAWCLQNSACSIDRILCSPRHRPSLTKLLSRSISGFTPSLAALPSSACDEALKLLDLLIDPDHESLADDEQFCCEDLAISLANLIARSTKPDSRLRAASILMRLKKPSLSLTRRMGEIQGFVTSLVDMISHGDQASEAALALLVEVCASSNRSRVAATEAGLVSAMAQLLGSNHGDQSSNCSRPAKTAKTETAMRALEVICQCAEGRAAVVSHGSVLVAVVKQMSSMSDRVVQHAVNVLLQVTKWAPEGSKVKSLVVKEGALLRAVAVAQSTISSDTKLAARKLAISLTEALPPCQLARTMKLA